MKIGLNYKKVEGGMTLEQVGEAICTISAVHDIAKIHKLLIEKDGESWGYYMVWEELVVDADTVTSGYLTEGEC